jgi:MFS family permease
MSNYSIALFLHIVGALGFFVVQGVEWSGLSQIRSIILPEEARAILELIKRTNRLGFISILTTVTTGIYMMLTVWRFVPWILVVLGSLILEIVIFVVLSGPRMAAIEQVLDTEERSVSKTFHTLVNHPILWISIHTRTAILLGIVFLKIAKPDLVGSLLTISIAIVLGLTLVFPVLRHERVQAGSAARMIIAFIVLAFAAALVLLAANSIPASTIPLSKTKSDVQGVQTTRSKVPTEVGSSNLLTQAPTPSPETVLQEGPSLLQTRCTQCHALQKILQVKKTRTEWENALSKMESFNVKISDAEKKVLLDYLTTVDNP